MQQLNEHRVVPVLVVERADQARPLGEALLAGGISIAEVTMRTPAATSVMAAMSELPDLLVGAGTVLTSEQVDRAHDAGARFIVSPGLDHGVVERALSLELPVFPGVATPSEIMAAMSLGLSTLKFFPASLYGGLSAIKAFASPFGQVRFIPTGGIGQEDFTDYLAQPNVAAVGGSWMAPPKLVSNGDFDAITDICRATSAAAEPGRDGSPS